jgi:H+/gluconate symporter-like permease
MGGLCWQSNLVGKCSNYVFIQIVVPLIDTSWLAEPLFGSTTIESVRGVWAVIVALFFAILLLIAGNWRRLADLRASLDQGADASVLPIFNTASLVGFGAVIAALPVFDLISEAVLAVGGGNPLVSVAASVTVLSAMTGSASGGMSIALDALGRVRTSLKHHEPWPGMRLGPGRAPQLRQSLDRPRRLCPGRAVTWPRYSCRSCHPS